MSNENIRQLQTYEQSLQQLLLQKQQFQMQLAEIESALQEMEGKDDAFKMIGNIMVAVKSDELRADLKNKKETVELRIGTIDKQEKDIREKAESLQKEVMQGMKENENG